VAGAGDTIAMGAEAKRERGESAPPNAGGRRGSDDHQEGSFRPVMGVQVDQAHTRNKATPASQATVDLLRADAESRIRALRAGGQMVRTRRWTSLPTTRERSNCRHGVRSVPRPCWHRVGATPGRALAEYTGLPQRTIRGEIHRLDSSRAPRSTGSQSYPVSRAALAHTAARSCAGVTAGVGGHSTAARRPLPAVVLAPGPQSGERESARRVAR
jgi:hypothetical protein